MKYNQQLTREELESRAQLLFHAWRGQTIKHLSKEHGQGFTENVIPAWEQLTNESKMTWGCAAEVTWPFITEKRSWAFLRSGFAFSVIVAACLGVFLGLLVSGMRTEMCLVLSVIVCIGTCVITDALSCIGNEESKD